jgi:hypothetical protein
MSIGVGRAGGRAEGRRGGRPGGRPRGGGVERLVPALRHHVPRVHEHDVVGMGQVLRLMCHEDTRGAPEQPPRAKHLMREALKVVIRGHQRPSVAISGNSGHQRHSEAIRGHQRPSEALGGHQRPSEALRGPQRPSEALRGPQRHSEAKRRTCLKMCLPTCASTADRGSSRSSTSECA